MGLDQYVYSDERQNTPDMVDDDLDVYEGPLNGDDLSMRDGVEEIFYFRKHHDLQGWMSELAKKRDANIQWDSMIGAIVLTIADLKDLKIDVEGEALPETEGFFFGSGNTEFFKPNTMEMIERAKKAIEEGKTIIYRCSW